MKYLTILLIVSGCYLPLDEPTMQEKPKPQENWNDCARAGKRTTIIKQGIDF